jgi:hypothetical protein
MPYLNHGQIRPRAEKIMITELSIICGQILEFVETKGGFTNFNEIKAHVGVADHLILMSLGWLCHKKHIHVVQDPSTTGRRSDDLRECQRTTLVFGALHEQVLMGMLKTESEETERLIRQGIGRILNLLNESNGRITLKDIERDFDAPFEIILMAIGFLAKEGHIKETFSKDEILIFRLPQAEWAQKAELLSHYKKET